MSQFDGELDAVLAQLEFEKLAEEPGGDYVEITGDLLSFIGAKGLLPALGRSLNFLQKIRKLAGTSYTKNLIYVAEAVRSELRRLYQQNEDLRDRIESLQSNPQFAEAISALALQAMRTSVRNRLKRLALIIANGVKHDDLKPDSIDDMLRAATQLTDFAILALQKISKQQGDETVYSLDTSDGTINLPREVWQRLEQENFINPKNQMAVRSSLARLQALGLGAEIQTMESSWRPRFLVSPDGQIFCNTFKKSALRTNWCQLTQVTPSLTN